MNNMKSYNEFTNERFSDNIKKTYSNVTKRVREFTIKGLYRDTIDFSKSFWLATKRESKETKQAFSILRKMIKGHEVSDSEKKFFRKQAGDIAKLFPLIAIQGIPGGSVAITPLLISIGKKYNFEPFPTANKPLEEDDKPVDKG